MATGFLICKLQELINGYSIRKRGIASSTHLCCSARTQYLLKLLFIFFLSSVLYLLSLSEKVSIPSVL